LRHLPQPSRVAAVFIPHVHFETITPR
jgi:hypothetical protein